jgi:hypothetical protein
VAKRERSEVMAAELGVHNLRQCAVESPVGTGHQGSSLLPAQRRGIPLHGWGYPVRESETAKRAKAKSPWSRHAARHTPRNDTGSAIMCRRQSNGTHFAKVAQSCHRLSHPLPLCACVARG